MTNDNLERFLKSYTEGTEPGRLDYSERRRFSGLNDEEIIEYSRTQGYFKMSPSQAKKTDVCFYREIVKRDLVDAVFKRKKRKNSTLKNWGLVKEELLKIINELGHFPTHKDFLRLGKSSIGAALRDYHGGYHKVREKLGYDNKSKEPNYWKKFENVKKELDIVIKHTGHFPTLKEFREMNRDDLSSAIQKNYGGLDAVRKRLGYSYIQKPKKYWKNWDNLERELQEVIESLGHFPLKNELENMGRNDISVGIQKYHGGLSQVRRKMGYELSKRPNGELNNVELIKQEITLIISDHPELNGGFPSDYWLRNNGYQSISEALYRHHGSINVIREEMGYKPPIRQPNYLKSWENIETELKEVIQQIGHFPTQQELKDLGKSSIAGAIVKYHGGMISTRQRFEHCEIISHSQNLERMFEDYVGGETK